MEKFAELLKVFVHLETLDIKGNELNDTSFPLVIDSLLSLKYLKHLDISTSPITNVSFIRFLMKLDVKFETLNVTNCLLGDDGLLTLFYFIIEKPQLFSELKFLGLDVNRITEKSKDTILKFINVFERSNLLTVGLKK